VISDEQHLRRHQKPFERHCEAAVEIVQLVRPLDAARDDLVGQRLVQRAAEQQSPDGSRKSRAQSRSGPVSWRGVQRTR
jgi:hypothetical protein